MSLFDLIRDKDGTMSHTKLWANIASAMACYQIYKTDSIEMVGMILGILVLGRFATKGLDVLSDMRSSNVQNP